MDTLWTVVNWAGRIGFTVYLIFAASAHFTNHKGITGYAQARGVPMASTAVVASGVILVAGALMVLFHWHVLWGLALIVLFMVPVAVMVHHFWTETDPMMRANEMAHFGKNLTIASAALLYAACIHS